MFHQFVLLNPVFKHIPSHVRLDYSVIALSYSTQLCSLPDFDMYTFTSLLTYLIIVHTLECNIGIVTMTTET